MINMKEKTREKKRKRVIYWFFFLLYSLDPCARVNCNNGRCEVDRGTAVCRCYQGYGGHDCLTPTGMCELEW